MKWAEPDSAFYEFYALYAFYEFNEIYAFYAINEFYEFNALSAASECEKFEGSMNSAEMRLGNRGKRPRFRQGDGVARERSFNGRWPTTAFTRFRRDRMERQDRPAIRPTQVVEYEGCLDNLDNLDNYNLSYLSYLSDFGDLRNSKSFNSFNSIFLERIGFSGTSRLRSLRRAKGRGRLVGGIFPVCIALNFHQS